MSRREARRGFWLGWPAVGEPEAVYATASRAVADAVAATGRHGGGAGQDGFVEVDLGRVLDREGRAATLADLQVVTLVPVVEMQVMGKIS